MEDEKAQSRTIEEEFLGVEVTEDFNSHQYSIFLDQLFSLGTIPEESFKICDGLVAKLRVLLPVENLEIAKKVDAAPGFYSKEIILKLETLSRAISAINNQPIRFSNSMIDEWQKFRNTTEKPTEIDQQRYIIQYRFKQFIIDEIYKKYQELLVKQESALVNLKKN